MKDITFITALTPNNQKVSWTAWYTIVLVTCLAFAWLVSTMGAVMFAAGVSCGYCMQPRVPQDAPSAVLTVAAGCWSAVLAAEALPLLSL